VMLQDVSTNSNAHRTPEDALLLSRFLEEAQVTGQLEHPGIVPIHELGLDESGHVYFTMRLVRGRDLRSVIEKVHAGDPEWSQTRVLDVLLRACDAMAYAHSRGVIHRDLKPGNIMAGRFGESYVMDWGLAKIVGRADLHDLRIAPEDTPPESERAGVASSDPDSPLMTRDGTVVGTPAYMSPEQARGQVEELGPQSDVYAMGAILYTVLSGRVPHVEPGEQVGAREVLHRVRTGPPARIETLVPGVSMELAAICERAMAREFRDRYLDMSELAADLRAYLEQRVVRAYATGPVAEMRKWIQRNKSAAFSTATGLLLLVLGSWAFSMVLQEQLTETRRERDLNWVRQIEARADELWPAVPTKLPEIRRWLADVESHQGRRSAYEAAMMALRRKAQPYSEEDRQRDRLNHPDQIPLRYQRDLARKRAIKADDLAAIDSDDRTENQQQALTKAKQDLVEYSLKIADLERRVGERQTWRFHDVEDQSVHDDLAEIVRGLYRLDEQGGIVDKVRARERGAVDLESRLRSPAWQIAIDDIAELPHYNNLRLGPQVGLEPLERNEKSQLWEFWIVQSGDRPTRNPDPSSPNHWAMTEETGAVLVLVPRGEFRMGSEERPNESQVGTLNTFEGPSDLVTVGAFFASKYEISQAQYQRLMDHNPSQYRAGLWNEKRTYRHTALHPVEQLSWHQSKGYCERLGLQLPTEAQWEYVARAGTTDPWSSGPTREQLRGYANVADRAALLDGAEFAGIWAEYDDGFAFTAPVGSYLPNAWGFHDVHGNVQEWCRDRSARYGDYDVRAGDGLRLRPLKPTNNRFIARGGGCYYAPEGCRSASRADWSGRRISGHLGFRPVKAIH